MILTEVLSRLSCTYCLANMRRVRPTVRQYRRLDVLVYCYTLPRPTPNLATEIPLILSRALRPIGGSLFGTA